ncbi:hypothetical protein S7335_5168 [Synechococcus sp. PCC 7335]|uniref:hypothetical protein n=1 Tax=Synechococcus sp. (strain ATCC 29403 / PCC 7335) TaxID=91464 RepID=UPI00017EC37E|nr:hypothetical protein [Synechococcus sp. PCC 7335]EDX87458.1 hypothetical protein S7335_5168 [Synechococcus sp. PCC 7335]
MKTKLICLTVDLQVSADELRKGRLGSDLMRSDALRSHVETQLAAHGDPLRWAITAVDSAGCTAQVEAVVTTL